MHNLKWKWRGVDEETPAGSDLENNPGEFLKELEPLYPWSKRIFDPNLISRNILDKA